jgi:hypothetical protein
MSMILVGSGVVGAKTSPANRRRIGPYSGRIVGGIGISIASSISVA